VQRRQEILDRTMEVFADKGLEGTSLRAIGEAIGVSHAALKHYFPSREALLLEVLRARDAELAAARPANQPVVEQFAADAGRNATVPGLIALYTSLMGAAVVPGNDVSREFFTERFRRIRRRLADEVRRGQADGTIRTDVDPDFVASVLIAVSDGLQVQWLLEPTIDLASDMPAFLATVLAPPAPKTPPSRRGPRVAGP
jgi:AcrR family transcriptional regulator